MSSQNDCQCSIVGHCPRYRRIMTDREIHLCQTREDYRRLFERTAPPPGLGDKVETVIHSVGGHYLAKAWSYWTGKPCGCDSRRESLNALSRSWENGPGPKVCFVTPSLGMGGAERVMLSQARYWPRFGITPKAFWLHDNGPAWGPFLAELAEMNIPVHASTRRRERGIVAADTMVDALRAAVDGVDVVISWGLPDVGDLLDAAGWTGRHILVAHGPGDWARNQMTQAAPSASHFAAVSRAAIEAFPPEAHGMTTVLWNGAETSRLQAKISREEQRARWGVPRGYRAIGYIGRFSFNKRPEVVARAVARLPEDCIAVMIGDGIEAKPITKLAREIAGDRIIIPGPTDDVGSALDGLDAWMLCSDAEGFSIALTEAMLSGTPIVTNHVGAVDDLQEKFGELFCCVPNGASDDELAAACLRALSPSGRSIADHARRVALEHLTAELSAQRWAEWLREICPVAV